MASLFKKKITRYLDAAGRRVPKGTPGARKKLEQSKKWYGRYKDEAGEWRDVALFTDKTASQVELAKIVTSVERGEAGLVSPFKQSLARPVEEHILDYLDVLKTQGVNPKHFSERSRILRTVLRSCEVGTLADLTTDRLNDYIAGMKQSARTKDTHRGAVHAFGEWLVQVKRLQENPARAATKPKGKIERPRRTESVENLQALLKAARERPLIEAATVRKGPRAGERYADIRPSVREDRVRLGRERALLYKTALYTGMREGELRRLKVSHLRLDGDNPTVLVAPEHDRKNKTAIVLPLTPALASELGRWIADTGKSRSDVVFYVPDKPNKIFRRDLRLAGIPYRDSDGRYFDFHALRHCTDTYLNAAGVSPSVVMLFMRHRHIKLSLQTYNDPRMHETRTALSALPTLD